MAASREVDGIAPKGHDGPATAGPTYGRRPGSWISSPSWIGVLFVLATIWAPWLVDRNHPHLTLHTLAWMAPGSLLLLAIEVRRLRDLESASMTLDGPCWQDVDARVAPALRERGYERRVTSQGLWLHRESSSGASDDLVVLRLEHGISLQGPRVDVRRVCRSLGRRGPGLL